MSLGWHTVAVMLRGDDLEVGRLDPHLVTDTELNTKAHKMARNIKGRKGSAHGGCTLRVQCQRSVHRDPMRSTYSEKK